LEAYPWQRLVKARLPQKREVKPLEAVIATRFAEGYKRRPDETKRQNELEN
jgi:hypothetical protein